LLNLHAKGSALTDQIDPETRPSIIGPPFTGHFRVQTDAPQGLQPFQPAARHSTTPGKPLTQTQRASSSAPPKDQAKAEIRRSIFDKNGADITKQKEGESEAEGEVAADGEAGDKSEEKSAEELAKVPKPSIHCSSCGIDCTGLYYHRINKPEDTSSSTAAGAANGAIVTDYNLCPSCHREGRLRGRNTNQDFTKVEDPSYTRLPDRSAPWTDIELLKLLEALEVNDDNWARVAEHVGTRTREECVLKFLQLEIEDKYLSESLSVGDELGNAENDTAMEQAILSKSLNYGRIPFTNAENPVMSVVSYLTGMVEPTAVAAAAGRASTEVLTNMGAQRRALRAKNSSSDASAVQEGGESAGVKAEDAMDVDASSTALTTASGRAAAGSLSTRDPATIALAAAAARASALASHEERRITRLVSDAQNALLDKLELKMRQFTQLEAILQEERRELLRARRQLFLDRVAFRKRVGGVETALTQRKLELDRKASGGGDKHDSAVESRELPMEERLSFGAPDAGPGGMGSAGVAMPEEGKVFEV
jgi:SWI/SNF related-matrix-associated actin-dependent regulator of chromatin subfamily C